jgi:hypothetical protein
MYVSVKRGSAAIEVLEAALAAQPKDGVARAYLGEARRQTGDAQAAASDLAQALRDGAPSDFVVPSVTKLLYDLRREPAAAQGLPGYAAAAATFLLAGENAEIRVAVARWLAFDAEKTRGDLARTALLYSTAVRHAWAVVSNPPPGTSAARLAYQASEWRKAVGASAPGDLPGRYELLSASVRQGAGGETDEVPEAVAALAEVALEEERFALAHAMATRRLALSDSPAARRVLLALPPDVGR